jgi:glyoxylase-like metal-dependent hydrolase (beta-lactamase superfamily II)
MKAVGLHPDVVVVTSRFWQTTCTLVRSGEEAFCIDSPVLPDELEILPSIAEQARFRIVGLLLTHADFDHVLGRYAFPDAPLGIGEPTDQRLQAEPGRVQKVLRDFDEEWYIERPGPLTMPEPQVLPVPGRCGIGDEELELHPAPGHTADGMAIWIDWARTLVCGDYLSPVEIPWISEGGSRDAYLATLRRLEPIVEAAAHVVPGHGQVLDGVRAAAILREDVNYLAKLPDAELPLARRGPAQRAIHEANVERVRRSS